MKEQKMWAVIGPKGNVRIVGDTESHAWNRYRAMIPAPPRLDIFIEDKITDGYTCRQVEIKEVER